MNSLTTSGASAVDFVGEHIATRRIDIRADRPEFVHDALPHEITHVVLADAFIRTPIPPWADEGLAMSAELEPYQQRHLAALRRLSTNEPAYGLAELFALNSYPAGERQAQFYRQSTSIVKCLVSRGTPAEFMHFLHTAASSGYDEALKIHYGIDGVAQLERMWRHSNTPQG